jgi:hypothetical protein
MDEVDSSRSLGMGSWRDLLSRGRARPEVAKMTPARTAV